MWGILGPSKRVVSRVPFTRNTRSVRRAYAPAAVALFRGWIEFESIELVMPAYASARRLMV